MWAPPDGRPNTPRRGQQLGMTLYRRASEQVLWATESQGKPMQKRESKREDNRCFARRRHKQTDVRGEASYSLRSCDARCPFAAGSRQLQQQH